MKQLSEPTALQEAKQTNTKLCGLKIKREPEERDCFIAAIGASTRPLRDNNNNNKEKGDNKAAVAQQLLSVIRKGDFGELLDMLRSKPDLNVFVNGQTALHYCLLQGRDVSWCQQLVNNGANPNLSNHEGWHPIHLAAFNGLHESLTYLVTCNSRTMSDVI